MKRASQWLLRSVLWLALVAITWLALTPGAPAMPGESDKLAHGLAFLALAGLADFAYPRQPLLYKLLPLAGYGLALELAQGLLPYREASFLDWLADAAGLAAYASLAPLLRRRRRSQPAGRGGVFLK